MLSFDDSSCLISMACSRVQLVGKFLLKLFLLLLFLTSIYLFSFRPFDKPTPLAELPEVEQNIEENYIRANNSDFIHGRLFSEYPYDELCSNKPDVCVDSRKKVFTWLTVAPQYKISACLVLKSASTAINGAFCYLQNETFHLTANRSSMVDWVQPTECWNNNIHGFDKYTEKYGVTDEWKTFFIKREPIDRFISSFIHWCIDLRSPCLGCGYNMTCFLENMIVSANKYKNDYTKFKNEETHAFPQTWYCDLHERVKDYHVAHYTADPNETLLPSFTNFLRNQKVPESSIEEVNKSLGKERVLHTTNGSKYRNILERRLRREPYLLELLVRLVHDDFKVLGYPYPL